MDPSRRRLLARAASLAAAVAPFGLAFGVLCTQAGLHPVTALGFSVLVFTGSAQFAAVAVLGAGGTVTAAVVAGLLLNVRCLAFGLVMAPVFPRSRLRRAIMSQLMIDATIPAAFLALVWPRLADPGQRRIAALGAVIALALVPVLPAGLPIIMSAAAIPVALRMARPGTDPA